ncbi:transaldolase family protein [Litorivicinus lipolyticus]|uniref:transaldolase family protein n=1 Tax=Litorivicinus lipolyticus TaxID=418701 RepID=UPI0014782549|nr:transaldolase family protein [Litorivicinus lipolyticus]
MILFLDTADTKVWDQLSGTGYWAGITTNPLLLQRAGVACTLANLAALYDTAMALGYPTLHVQVFGDDWVQCGRDILALGPHTRVKIPAIERGFKAAHAIACPERTTFTAVYATGQVMAASAFGAAYCAPYYARLSEASGAAHADSAFSQMASAATHTQLLIASLRSVEQVADLAGRGFDCFALPPAIATAWTDPALALAAVDDFEMAARTQLPPL